MSWYGDPDDLDRLAHHLAGLAERVRDRAGLVRASARAGHWRGRAADAFHGAVAGEAAVLDRAAGELDDAAACLHRHAESVRAELARLRAIERAAEQFVCAGLARLGELVS